MIFLRYTPARGEVVRELIEKGGECGLVTYEEHSRRGSHLCDVSPKKWREWTRHARVLTTEEFEAWINENYKQRSAHAEPPVDSLDRLL